MKEFFGNKYGLNSIIEAKVITDQHTKQSKGFGFVRFHSQQVAQKAMQECNGHYLLTK
jgi:RNA recognition motif-containing protein